MRYFLIALILVLLAALIATPLLLEKNANALIKTDLCLSLGAKTEYHPPNENTYKAFDWLKLAARFPVLGKEAKDLHIASISSCKAKYSNACSAIQYETEKNIKKRIRKEEDEEKAKLRAQNIAPDSSFDHRYDKKMDEALANWKKFLDPKITKEFCQEWNQFHNYLGNNTIPTGCQFCK